MAEAMAYFPAEWEDDDRMNFMFSAFPESRDVNPKHWDSKLQFWSNLILENCRHCDELAVDMATLRQRFSRNNLAPLGLETVLTELIKAGKLQKTEDFANSVNQSWASWSYGIAKKSLSWSMFALLGFKESVEGSLVVLERLKEKSEQVLAVHFKNVQHEITDFIIPWNVVKARCKAAGYSLDDAKLELVMCYLQKQCQAVVVITKEGEKAVKFALKRQDKVKALVSDADLEILSLKKAIASLTLKVKKLTNAVESLRQKAAALAKQNLRTAALKVIKTKAQQQRLLDRAVASLTTLEELLHRIQNAETDKMIVDALKSGHSALKKAQDGLSAESVDKIMSDVEEALEDSEEIKSALAEGNQNILASAGLEGDDLMKELEQELAELTLNPSGQPMGVLPSPPTESPSQAVLDRLPEVPSQSPLKGAERDRSGATPTALLE